MKCPRCGAPFNDAMPSCPGCDFSMDDLARRVGRRPPAREGWFSDLAGAFELHEAREIDAVVAGHNRSLRRGGQILVATISSSAPALPREVVFWLFNDWKVGGAAHEGILVLFSLEERRVECEVGFGWEHIITDQASGEVLDEKIVPLLKKDNLREAIEATAAAMAEIIGAAGPVATDAPAQSAGGAS